MSFTIIIPARYASTRLPGKPLLEIGDKCMIEHVVDKANKSLADRVIVATDDERIQSALLAVDCEVCMTSEHHQSGSDRLAEVVEQCNLAKETIIVNVQGDEPFINPDLINLVAQALHNRVDIPMSTAAHAIQSDKDINNPNVVKVVFNQKKEAMYFSRSAIPYVRDAAPINANVYWKHIGIYAYRAGFLSEYQKLRPSQKEQLESLEQLRVLDNGEKIIVETFDDEVGIGIDTEEDLLAAREMYQKS